MSLNHYCPDKEPTITRYCRLQDIADADVTMLIFWSRGYFIFRMSTRVILIPFLKEKEVNKNLSSLIYEKSLICSCGIKVWSVHKNYIQKSA